jgi:isoquinoline 1-oxidoreductase subunit beta
MKGFWVRYRLAGARARARLVAAAAEAWEVPAGEVQVERGVLRHATGRQATFADLAAQAERLPVPDGVQPKDAADYKLIGQEGRLRVDAVPKILGATHFTIDLSLPGMLTAVVLHPPRFGATLAAVDAKAALAEAGVTAVVPIDEGVGVVGETVADAQRGLRALVVEWDDTNAERRSTAQLLAEHVRLLESGENAVTAPDDGDVDQALADATWTVDATYMLPYLSHAPMEPNNAACRMREDGVLEVWVGSEAPEYVKMNASSIAGIDKEQVEVHITFAGGSFGLHSSAEHDPTPSGPDRARARLGAPDQGAVAAGGGVQGGSLPRDGRSPGEGRSGRGRSPHRLASADRGRADFRQSPVRP